MNWINVAEDRDKGRLLVNTVMEFFLNLCNNAWVWNILSYSNGPSSSITCWEFLDSLREH